MGSLDWSESEFSNFSESSASDSREENSTTERGARVKVAFVSRDAAKQGSSFIVKETKAPASQIDVPDDYVLKKKKELEKRLKPSVFSGFLFLIILFGGLSFACFWYCHIHDPWTIVMRDNWLVGWHEEYDYHFLWFLIGFMFLVFILLLIVFIFVSINNYSSRQKSYQRVKKMSLDQFKKSEYYWNIKNTYKQE